MQNFISPSSPFFFHPSKTKFRAHWSKDAKRSILIQLTSFFSSIRFPNSFDYFINHTIRNTTANYSPPSPPFLLEIFSFISRKRNLALIDLKMPKNRCWFFPFSSIHIPNSIEYFINHTRRNIIANHSPFSPPFLLDPSKMKSRVHRFKDAKRSMLIRFRPFHFRRFTSQTHSIILLIALWEIP